MDAFTIALSIFLIATLMLAVAIYLATCWSQESHTPRVTWQEAHARAEALLKDVLTDAELAQLGEHNYLEVRSPSQATRTYRVPRRGGRVTVVEDGMEVESLCVTPIEAMPPADVVITHKLMIEGNEPEYLRRANHYLLKAPVRVSVSG